MDLVLLRMWQRVNDAEKLGKFECFSKRHERLKWGYERGYERIEVESVQRWTQQDSERAPVRKVNTATEERILVDRVLMRGVDWQSSDERGVDWVNWRCWVRPAFCLSPWLSLCCSCQGGSLTSFGDAHRLVDWGGVRGRRERRCVRKRRAWTVPGEKPRMQMTFKRY